jgi:hypothetical protein
LILNFVEESESEANLNLNSPAVLSDDLEELEFEVIDLSAALFIED